MSDGRTTRAMAIQNILNGLGICADNGEKEEYIQELLQYIAELDDTD